MNKPITLRIAATLALALCTFGVAAQGTYQLAITDPPDEAIVSTHNGTLAVRVAVVPALNDGDRLEFLVDGMPVAEPGGALVFQLPDIAPGLHALQSRIIDASGNVGAISPMNVLTVVGDSGQESRLRDGASPDPILDSRWGPGDADSVSLLHFQAYP